MPPKLWFEPCLVRSEAFDCMNLCAAPDASEFAYPTCLSRDALVSVQADFSSFAGRLRRNPGVGERQKTGSRYRLIRPLSERVSYSFACWVIYAVTLASGPVRDQAS